MKKVLTFGTFDIFHPGHEFFLKKAKKYGDVLGVVIARDKTVKKIKGKLPRNNEKKRLAKVKIINYADEVFLGELEDKYLVVEKFQPDIICLGYDQDIPISALQNELACRGINVRVIKFRKSYKPHLYKSSKM